MSATPLAVASAALEAARRSGADAAEAIAMHSEEREILARGDRIERADSASTRGLGIRVFVGASQGLSYTTRSGARDVRLAVEEAVGIARAAEADPFSALPEPALTPSETPDVAGLFDERVAGLSDGERISRALAAEAAARDVPGIVNSEGSTFADRTTRLGVASSTGLAWEFQGTRCSLSSRPVAADRSGGQQQVQMWHTAARALGDLEPAESVGARAAARAVRMLGARPGPTGRAAVLFDSFEAGRFWGGLLTAFSGDAAGKGLSFLAGTLGSQVASRRVTLVDDGRLPGGLASIPRDGEGLPTRRKPILQEGVLATFLHDCRSARRAGMQPTANAVRGYSTLPSVGAFNVHLMPGEQAEEEIIRSTPRGLYVTHLIGFGVNLTTGDYSRGANGLWIEGGEIAYPVQEVVISGNLREMLRGISAVASEFVPRAAVSSPAFRIDSMVISGKTMGPGGQD